MISEFPVTRPESGPATPRRECYRQLTTLIPANMELAPRKGTNSRLSPLVTVGNTNFARTRAKRPAPGSPRPLKCV
jgi:hypothetical protein